MSRAVQVGQTSKSAGADLGSLHSSVAYECCHVSEQSCCIVRREVSQAAPRKTIVVRHVRQFHSLPSRVISLSTSFKEVPRVAEEERLHFREEFENYWHFEVSFGFMEAPSLREVIEAARVKCADLDLDFDKMTFFAASDEVVRDPARPRLPWWRYKLFRFLYRNSVHVVDRFDLPAKDYVEVGRLMPL